MEGIGEKLPAVSIARLREKEAILLRELEFEAAKIGEGVTKEAQQIFNALSKTYIYCFFFFFFGLILEAQI